MNRNADDQTRSELERDQRGPGIQGLIFDEPPIFELGAPGRQAASLPPCEVEEKRLQDLIPADLLREEVDHFPEVSEVELVRHYTRLSQWNFGVDLGFYPLGSCTMKYNPKVNEVVVDLPGFALSHPLQGEELSQGCLRLMYELGEYLKEIGGMDAITLQPAAGAHGELVGMMAIKAYFDDRGEKRKKVLLPDSAHGTNPASAALCGYTVEEIKSGRDGCIDIGAIKAAMDGEVAALMTTNPNTLGLFEENLAEVAGIIHERGGLVYCDGANLNAVMGISRPGDIGIDVLHYNLHKTFSTPHGGGGPGAGPLAVKKKLAPYLPAPLIEKDGDGYRANYDLPKSIGKVRAFWGNFAVLARAYAYIRSMGPDGLKRASQVAVLNANYIKSRLQDQYHLPYNKFCMHECVFSDKLQGKSGVTTLDIAKRLIDFGFHPPTIYFPLIVKGAMMIEPTETESKETLDAFVEAMRKIALEAQTNPQLLKAAPTISKLSRLDEIKAAREPRLRWQPRAKKP